MRQLDEGWQAKKKKKMKVKAKKKRPKRKEVKKEDGSHSSLITKREKGYENNFM